MAWRRPGDKPLSEPMMVRLKTHICVSRPQWVKGQWVWVRVGMTIRHLGTVIFWCRAEFRLAPSQWETSLQSNAISHWLGANLESSLLMAYFKTAVIPVCWQWSYCSLALRHLFYRWLSKVCLASGKRCCILTVFSLWLRPWSALDRKQALPSSKDETLTKLYQTCKQDSVLRGRFDTSLFLACCRFIIITVPSN